MKNTEINKYKVLVINPILYTNEATKVRKVDSIKDCMIVDLCNAFASMGYDTTLVAADDYKPIRNEKYEFNIIWLKSYFPSIFIPNKIPCNFGLKKILTNNRFDLVISSEVFSIDTLIAVKYHPEHLIIWQEMAFHQHMAKQMASKIWHNVIVRNFYKNVRIVPRTQHAKRFISQYSNNVSDVIIQHGIDLDKFTQNTVKKNLFIVCSQLISRKRINKSIEAFKEFADHGHEEYRLYVVGDGEEKIGLQELTKKLGISDKVIFTGKLSHSQLAVYLSDAKAMLVYTEKDNSMISIAESIAVCTPVITTSIPDNSTIVEENNLGIVNDKWGWKELEEIVRDNAKFVNNCAKYRDSLDNRHNVKLFIKEVRAYCNSKIE